MDPTAINTLEQGWEPLTCFPGEGEVKILRDEGGCAARTMLVRIHPGGYITPHAHEGVVQHYILEGEYECGDAIFASGTYRFLPRHCNVDPITTQTGATILMIYDPIP